jgi:hypothetical protein
MRLSSTVSMVASCEVMSYILTHPSLATNVPLGVHSSRTNLREMAICRVSQLEAK